MATEILFTQFSIEDEIIVIKLLFFSIHRNTSCCRKYQNITSSSFLHMYELSNTRIHTSPQFFREFKVAFLLSLVTAGPISAAALSSSMFSNLG